MKCRHCKNNLNHTFVNLGYSPPSNHYVDPELINGAETYFPLIVKVCNSCFLVQTEDYNKADDLFTNDYAYFSSTSTSWLSHAKSYCEMITNHLKLDSSSFVVEIASNDGYLLQNFKKNNVPCLGIEPTNSTAIVSRDIGIETIEEFFSVPLSKKIKGSYGLADLIIGNNVYAHVPDINDFTSAMKLLLKSDGTITLEFPHLLNLIKHSQFDTIYHEHFSYLSLLTVSKIFNNSGLKIYDVEQIKTHGGSLRIYGCNIDYDKEISINVDRIISLEKSFGLEDIDTYKNFQVKAFNIKTKFMQFLLDSKKNKKTVVGYGAAAKGNTLLNYAGIKSDLIEFVCDAARAKQNKLLPGSRIPIFDPSKIREFKPDYVIIFPWNIKDEVISDHEYIREWGGKFVTFIPDMVLQ
jgi:hypothetical protein